MFGYLLDYSWNALIERHFFPGLLADADSPLPPASSTGAEMVSRHCQDAGDWEGAIEFLLMAKRTADAFSLAKSHAQMGTFTKVLARSPCYVTRFPMTRFLVLLSL